MVLSVWQTGPAAQMVSRAHRGWRREFEETLPDLNEDDIAGSGFAIRSYTVHRALDRDEALERLRRRLQERRLKLMLDFVPQPQGTGSPVDRRASRLLRPRQRERRGARAAQPLSRANEERPAGIGLWPRSLLRRLARHAAAQLRQPGITAGDDRRVGADRRPMRRRPSRSSATGDLMGCDKVGPPLIYLRAKMWAWGRGFGAQIF